ncbi:MAG: O-acetyl-ADP-ribose deacetylase [Candidatus Wallbacteria bacterium]|nr:O-acetyl-ADP-ribose deacetylase [Candidatus Wallbacteria bacterium]
MYNALMKKFLIKNCALLLKQGDITKEKVDAIVNAANSMLAGGGGVDGAIHEAGGPMIEEECRKIREMQGGCPAGEAVITPGGKLLAKYVIHTVGPVWQGGNAGEEELLRSSYRNSLLLAVKSGLYFVSLPSISTGSYGYPVDQAARVALTEVTGFLNKVRPYKLRQVSFVLFSEDILNIYRTVLEDIVVRSNFQP